MHNPHDSFDPEGRKPLDPVPADYRWLDTLIDCDEHRLAAALINYGPEDYAMTLSDASGWEIAEPLLLAVCYWHVANLQDEAQSDYLIRWMMRLAQEVLSCAEVLQANIHADVLLQDEGWYTPPTLEEAITVCQDADWTGGHKARENAFEPLLAMLKERYAAAWDARWEAFGGKAAS